MLERISDRVSDKIYNGGMALADNLQQWVERRRINLGDHMRVRVGKYPYDKQRILSDGTVINVGDRIGTIYLLRQLPKIDEKDSLNVVTRGLYQSVRGSLEELAALSINHDPRLEGVEAFYGASHVAGPLAQRLGFDVVRMEDWTDRMVETVMSQTIVFWKSPHKNWIDRWKQVKGKEAQEAYISKRKLVQLYG